MEEDRYATAEEEDAEDEKLSLKVALLGDSQTCKSTLMIQFVEGRTVAEDDYMKTLGVSFLEKDIAIRDATVRMSLWDVGACGQAGVRESVVAAGVPLACAEASIVLLLFDLSRRATLSSLRQWASAAATVTSSARPILVGTKWDFFCNLSESEQVTTTRLAQRYAKSLDAPLVYVSCRYSINVKKLFKLVVACAFGLQCNIAKNNDIAHGPIFVF